MSEMSFTEIKTVNIAVVTNQIHLVSHSRTGKAADIKHYYQNKCIYYLFSQNCKGI